MIVVDLGCFSHGVYDSIGSLQRKFHPDILYGFDPLAEDSVGRIGKTVIVTRRLAAWTRDGTVPFNVASTRSAIGKGKSVPCFDLCSWLHTLPEPIILKMDIEGGEFAVVKELKRTRTDSRLALLLLERHGDRFIPELRCPVEPWWM